MLWCGYLKTPLRLMPKNYTQTHQTINLNSKFQGNERILFCFSIFQSDNISDNVISVWRANLTTLQTRNAWNGTAECHNHRRIDKKVIFEVFLRKKYNNLNI